MNYNFADWNLTQLLPEINIYSDIDSWVEIEDEEEELIYVLESETIEVVCGITIKTAWTWEDIRLYLKDKGYIISINPTNYAVIYQLQEDGSYFDVEALITNSYENSRKAAIKYCLNLIKKT